MVKDMVSICSSEILLCTKCDLHKTCRSPIPGTNLLSRGIMIVGEAPGENEDNQGEPFVGRSGQILTESLRKVGLDRSDVFITNIVKCRPPDNRDPLPVEVEACMPWLKDQVSVLKPKLIVTLGRISASHLLGRKIKITKERGRVEPLPFDEDILVSIIYHPSYVLRNRNTKIEEDFLYDLEEARRIAYGPTTNAKIYARGTR